MSSTSTHEITQLLRAWEGGDKASLDKLIPMVYKELHRLAHRYMAEQAPGHTLQTTALINELYVRLAKTREANWQDRAHFFAVCARAMRQILTDFARSRRYIKRGGGAPHLSLDEAPALTGEVPVDLAALDDSLNTLAKVDPRASQVVEMRFFGGLTVEETAEVLKVSVETVTRDWRAAKAWLLRELTGEKHVRS
jgi:RNA polymerase sigma factor (TIGR02999 family)